MGQGGRRSRVFDDPAMQLRTLDKFGASAAELMVREWPRVWGGCGLAYAVHCDGTESSADLIAQFSSKGSG